jgi:hypothetical protein
MSGAQWMAGQLLRMADGRSAMPLENTRYNPRPPGVIRQGSASDEVLRILTENPNRYFTYAELRARCARSHAAMSWACIYLRRLGVVEVVGDGARNPCYLRYRIARN